MTVYIFTSMSCEAVIVMELHYLVSLSLIKPYVQLKWQASVLYTGLIMLDLLEQWEHKAGQ